MAKYIGTYATSGDVQTALNEQELSRPFIAYTTDNNKVIYGPNADRAEVGDIVVYSVTDDLLHYIKQADYNTTSYPVASYVPVGVVAIPQADDAILGPTGEITFMALKWTNALTPDVGGSSAGRDTRYGIKGLDFVGLTNYSNSGTAITDMTGKAENEIVIRDYCSANTDWKTVSAFTGSADANNPAPIFEVAWRYHTSGTVQGDWFVPSLGQLYYIVKNQDAYALLESGLTMAGGYSLDMANKNLGTSTEQDANTLWRVERGVVKNDNKQYSNMNVHPYCSKLMTRI